MIDAKQRETIRNVTRVMQIICLAQLAGIAAFAGYLLFLAEPRELPAGQTPLMTYLGLAAAVLAHPAGLFVTRLMVRAGQANRSPAGDDHDGSSAVPTMANIYQTQLIIRCALLEGAAFFNGAAYLVEGDRVSLVTMGLLAAGIVLLVPSRDRVESWINRQLASIRNERQWTDS